MADFEQHLAVLVPETADDPVRQYTNACNGMSWRSVVDDVLHEGTRVVKCQSCSSIVAWEMEQRARPGRTGL